MRCRGVYFLLILCSYFLGEVSHTAFCGVPQEQVWPAYNFAATNDQDELLREEVQDTYSLKSDSSLGNSSSTSPVASCILIDKPYWVGKLSSAQGDTKLLIDVTKDGFGDCYVRVPRRKVSDKSSLFPCNGVLVRDLVIDGKSVPAGSKLYMHESGGLDAAELIQNGALRKDTLWNKISSFYWVRQKASLLCLNALNLSKGFIFFLWNSSKRHCCAVYNAIREYIAFCNKLGEKRNSKTNSPIVK